MNRIGFVISSRGIRNSIERSLQIMGRFGITASKMQQRLRRYVQLVQEFGTTPSLPLTAMVLDRNPRVARMIKGMGAELCIHGLIHNDLSKLPAEHQYRHISEAMDIFRRHGIGFEGFRCPYLRHNSDTLRVVSDLGFKYDSSCCFYWEPAEALGELTDLQGEGLTMGLRFYNPLRYPQSRSLPWLINGLVEIPVSLPDDEILLDRMHLSPEKVGEIWKSMLTMAIERGEALILQLHPERFDILRQELHDVLALATQSSVWLASLRELASWWTRRMAVSAKIEGSPATGWRVLPSSERDIDLYLEVPEKGEKIMVSSEVYFRSRPLIGVDPGMPHDIKQKIKEMGYLIEIRNDSKDMALWFGSQVTLSEIEASISHCNHPILRAWHWPKGYRAACAVTGDIDCLTLGDFIRRFTEDRR